MRLEYLLLEETIKELSAGKTIFYLSNPGNYGDSLIRYGTFKFFAEKGIKYFHLQPQKRDWLLPFLTGGTVVLAGGGGWCSYWNHCEKMVQKLNKRFNIIVLPSSYETNYRLSNVTFFCRDRFNSLSNMPNAMFCHDMAFYIGRIEVSKGNGIGYFFRTDEESSEKIMIPHNNIDISLQGNNLTSVYPFFELISRYAVIYTDRLHVGIAASLMNKEVHLYPNAYFKIKAVYESSMKAYFDNVHFHEDFAF